MTKAQAARKLKALKALAERGVGGEKETAKRLYEELKKKYEMPEEAAEKDSDCAVSAFYMGMMGFAMQQEMENCSECPYRQEACGQCGTYENIKEICRRMGEARQKRGRAG